MGILNYFRNFRGRQPIHSFRGGVIDKARVLKIYPTEDFSGEIEIYYPSGGKLEIPEMNAEAKIEVSEIDKDNFLVELNGFEGRVGIPPDVVFEINGNVWPVYGVVSGPGHIMSDDVVEVAYPSDIGCVAMGERVISDGKPSEETTADFEDDDGDDEEVDEIAAFESEEGLEKIAWKPVRYPVNALTLIKDDGDVLALLSLSNIPAWLGDDIVNADKNNLLIITGSPISFVSVTRYNPEEFGVRRPVEKKLSLYNYAVACLQGVDPSG